MSALAALLLAVSVSGTVVDDLGRPVEDAEVRWADGAHSIAAGSGGIAAQDQTHTDARGRFGFDALPTTAHFEAQKPGYMFSELSELPRKGKPLTLVIDRTQQVRGRLRLEGKPPPNATLFDHQRGVDSDGRFDFPMTNNLTVVDVTGPDFAMRALPLTGKAGAVNDFGDVELERGVLLDLIVERDGGVIHGCALEVRPVGELHARSRLAREHPEDWRVGSFSFDPLKLEANRFPHLAAGEYGVWAEPDVPYSEVTLSKAPVRRVLQAVTPAVLAVTDASSRREPEPDVMVLDCSGHWVRVKLDRGRAEQPMAPGNCHLATPRQTFADGGRTVTLESGERTEVRLVDMPKRR